MMDRVWIACGYGFMPSPGEYGDGVDDFTTDKMDRVMAGHVWPLAKQMLRKKAVHRWYSSRREPGGGNKCWRGRLYLEVNPTSADEMQRALNKLRGEYQITHEETPDYLSGWDFDCLQRSCEIARWVLPHAMDHPPSWRRSEKCLAQMDMLVRNHPIVQTWHGMHWLENNLGMDTGFLMNRAVRGFYEVCQ